MSLDPLSATFSALADPTRRAILARLAHGPASVTDLAAPFDMALPSFLQHLRKLEDGGLIETSKLRAPARDHWPRWPRTPWMSVKVCP